MNHPRAVLGLIRLHRHDPNFQVEMKWPVYWGHLEAEAVEHLPEALGDRDEETGESLALVLVREFNELAALWGRPNRIRIDQAHYEPDPSWNREIAHQAGMGGLSATDYLGED